MSSGSDHTKLVIGIDYGTTNSGVAYAVVTDPNDESVDINVIRRWPHGQADNLPSDIAYDAKSGKPVGYGAVIPKGVEPLQWVKLLLEPAQFQGKQNTSSTERVWRSYEELKKLGKTPVDVIADYLRWLWGQIEKNLRDSGDDIDADETIVVITLPASWSDRARDGMLQAAKKAGIGSNGRQLKFRVEPEAAAIFELKARAKKKQIKVGDVFVVCDAGGGTVDVVSFQVLSLSPLSLDQVVVSQGDFCGSAFVNVEFEAQIRSILGSDFEKLSAETKALIRNEFEFTIKRQYHPEKPSDYSVPVPGLEDNRNRGIKDGKLSLNDAILRTSFETIMTQTLTLIDDQKKELETKRLLPKLKAILLVGGFGGSEYLHTRIRQEYPEDEAVRVWQGDHSWTAVVQGAVQCEVANREVYAPVNTRLSSYHYGIPYVRGPLKKVQWLVHKGEDVRSSSHIEPYLLRMQDRDWLDQEEYVTIFVQLVKTDEDNVTEDFDSSLRPHVEISCRVPTNIRKSPGASLVQENPRVWRIPAELILAMDGPLLTVRCRIQGKDVGVVDLKYHDEMDFPSHGLSAEQRTAKPGRQSSESQRVGEPQRSQRPTQYDVAPATVGERQGIVMTGIVSLPPKAGEPQRSQPSTPNEVVPELRRMTLPPKPSEPQRSPPTTPNEVVPNLQRPTHSRKTTSESLRSADSRRPSKDKADSILSHYVTSPAEIERRDSGSKDSSPRPDTGRRSTFFGVSVFRDRSKSIGEDERQVEKSIEKERKATLKREEQERKATQKREEQERKVARKKEEEEKRREEEERREAAQKKEDKEAAMAEIARSQPKERLVHFRDKNGKEKIWDRVAREAWDAPPKEAEAAGLF